MVTSLRKPTEQRRAEIADAALRLAGEQGLSALTMAALAQAIGLTSGALFRHFASRDAILEEAVGRAIARVDATFPEPATAPLAQVMVLARARIELLRSDPGVAWLLRSDEALLALPSRAVDALRDLVERSRAFLRDALCAAQSAGTVRRDLAVAHLLPIVTGTIHSLAGAPGVHRVAVPNTPHSLAPALQALRTVLSPTGQSAEEPLP